MAERISAEMVVEWWLASACRGLFFAIGRGDTRRVRAEAGKVLRQVNARKADLKKEAKLIAGLLERYG